MKHELMFIYNELSFCSFMYITAAVVLKDAISNRLFIVDVDSIQ